MLRNAAYAAEQRNGRKITSEDVEKAYGEVREIRRKYMLEKLGEHYKLLYEIIIKNLRMIMILRSKKFPIHKDDPRLLEALSYFGFTSLPLDWQDLWEKVLMRYLDSLKGLLTILMSIN